MAPQVKCLNDARHVIGTFVIAKSGIINTKTGFKFTAVEYRPVHRLPFFDEALTYVKQMTMSIKILSDNATKVFKPCKIKQLNVVDQLINVEVKL